MKIRLLILLLAAVNILAAEKCDIGKKFTGIPSPEWLDGTARTLKDLRGGKKFTVLYIWQPGQAALADFPRISAAADKFKKDAAFAGIAVSSMERIKRFPGAVRLGFPVNVDSRGAIIKDVVLPNKLPAALVLDSNDTLLWSGASAALPMILQECLAGKFDLKEEIRKNEFARAVNTAVKEQKFQQAFELLNAEWKKSCDSLELLNAQVVLLSRKLNRANDAFALLHEAQRKNPGDHRFFEAEYKLLGNPAFAQYLPAFFARIKKAFAGNPGVLMAFAMAEMGRPPETLDMQRVLSLAELGWRSQGFKKEVERGMFAIEYAKIAHTAGRTDIALRLCEIAAESFKSDAKRKTGAEKAAAYYRKLLKIAPLFKPVDLKK